MTVNVPFNKVVRPLVSKRVETMAGIDFGTNHVDSLLLGVVMPAIRV